VSRFVASASGTTTRTSGTGTYKTPINISEAGGADYTAWVDDDTSTTKRINGNVITIDLGGEPIDGIRVYWDGATDSHDIIFSDGDGNELLRVYGSDVTQGQFIEYWLPYGVTEITIQGSNYISQGVAEVDLHETSLAGHRHDYPQ
jgi:hypothetical protein